MVAIKAGWKTSEFWLSILGITAGVAGSVAHVVAPSLGVYAIPLVIAGGVLSYIAQRLTLKTQEVKQ